MFKPLIRALCPPFLWNLSSQVYRRGFSFFSSSKNDHIITTSINDLILRLPRSHNLPTLLAGYPYYEGEIDRLAQFLLETSSKLCVIDVGANVGDTVAMISSRDSATFLCVEGHSAFFRLLQDNLQHASNVVCVQAMASEADGKNLSKKLNESGGTAHAAESKIADDCAATVGRSIDGLILEYPEFGKANFLKVDTDGFDYRVLLGAEGLLTRSRPAIHIELSFRHWKEVGESTASQAAKYLTQLGYERCLIYDNVGYPIGSDNLVAPRLLPVLESYAFRRKFFYVNLVMFHGSDTRQTRFYECELSRAFDQSFYG